MPSLSRTEFVELIERERESPQTGDRRLLAPLALRILGDQLTPVLAYRRLVAPDERTAPSFLLESVEGGERVGRHSLLGARPSLELIATGREITLHDRRTGDTERFGQLDPLATIKSVSQRWRQVAPPAPPGHRRSPLPETALGGWFGYASYDSVRFAEPEKLAWSSAPPGDRHLAELQFAFHDRIVVFDHVEQLVYLVALVDVGAADDAGAAYDAALQDLRGIESVIGRPGASEPLPTGMIERDALLAARREGDDLPAGLTSNMTRSRHAAMVEAAREYIRAGDIFQVVLGQRFERRSSVDPFDVYRALRATNPSPYMVYMQARGVILVASSPEILCRVRTDRATGAQVVTNRPLAGTRRRGASAAEDAALERELLADEKERAEHIMLVDLGRNDVGRVSELGSVELTARMDVERYSHVMHISSTVIGRLRDDLDCWDALRATLPVGTISGAPKIRAMQIIDELEPVRRGPYGGGMGVVTIDGDMDIALALRTIVVPTALRDERGWVYHLQAAGGIVADSQPEPEYQETVNKAAALAQAIDVAERAFS